MEETKATSFDDFEKQLKQQTNGEDAKTLDDFANELKSQVNQATTPIGEQQTNPNGKTVKVKKNIVLSFPSDFTGCGHIRNIFPMTYLSNLYGKSGQMICMIAPFYIRQTDVLARARALFFQRQMNEPQYKILQHYKRLQGDLKYKMIWDMDDMIWGKNSL